MKSKAETALWDFTYRRWRNAVAVVSAVSPIIIAYAFERQIQRAMGQEAAIGLFFAAQIGAVAFFPDRVAIWAADCAVKDAKRNGEVGDDPDPPPKVEAPIRQPVGPWSTYTRHELRRGDIIWTKINSPRAWVQGHEALDPKEAEADDVARYWATLILIFNLEGVSTRLAAEMVEELRNLFAKTVMNHRREASFFRDHSPEQLLIALEVYVTSRKGIANQTA